MENLYLSDTENASVEKLLPHEQEEGCEQTLTQIHKFEKRAKARRWLRILRDVVIYALALWGLFNILSQAAHDIPKIIHHEHHRHEHSHREHHASLAEMQRSCACGNTTAQALSLGCVYDSLSPAWMQPRCQDAELTAEFETLGDGPNGTWRYFSDRNHTQELSVPEVMAMADDPDARFHVTWEWHVTHCWMYWIKQFRAPTTGVVVEARYDSEDHIRHCAKVFQNPVWGTSSGVVLNADVDGD